MRKSIKKLAAEKNVKVVNDCNGKFIITNLNGQTMSDWLSESGIRNYLVNVLK